MMSSLESNHEAEFISAFIIPDKKNRYSEFLQKPKRRQEILNRFNHCFDFLPTLSTQVKRSSGKEMANLLRRQGAGSKGYIIGGDDDAVSMPLEEAIERCLASPSGAIISCVPGRLALFLQEFPPGDAFLLSR